MSLSQKSRLEKDESFVNGKTAQDWLLSQNKYQKERASSKTFNIQRRLFSQAKTISIASGKGGVGKTSISIKMAKMLSRLGHKVLLIDCDYNLSNTAIKLGFPLNNNFSDFMKGTLPLEECLYRDGNFHLLPACNGNLDIFNSDNQFSRDIIDLLASQEKDYDFIMLDSPAGLDRDILTINAYCDYRFIIVTPDKSSITDSYSLMKILKTKFGIHENHLILNKINNKKQFDRIVHSLSETVENFLASRLQILGGISYESNAVDLLDGPLFEEEKSALHDSFSKVIDRFSEEVYASCHLPEWFSKGETKQDVQTS